MPDSPSAISVGLTVNGEQWRGDLDPRITVLDALRDELGVMSVKKGCDHGQCGACTVIADGRRVLACLALAASYDEADVLTAEGLGTVDDLAPMQQAFVDRDALQCGYCTPGQICSAVAMIDEATSGTPSHVSASVGENDVTLTDTEIRERMSGNLCRCGAYVNIVAAIADVATDTGLR